MIQSVQKALHLLTVVAGESEPVGVRELSRRSGLTVPTTQNLLKTMASSGFLEFDERSRKYRVGLACLLVAESANPVTAIRTFGHPYVESLHETLGMTVVLLTGWQGRCLVADWCETRHGLPVHPAGRVLSDPFGMATGRALLAWRPELAPDTNGTDACLAQIRRQGFAVTENLKDSGVYAVAAPVHDACGSVAMSVGCSTPLSPLDDEGKQRIRAAVVDTARAMSDALITRTSRSGR